jgi:MoaA/NifB/PqqE/SkfB family radical SAM enzyme
MSLQKLSFLMSRRGYVAPVARRLTPKRLANLSRSGLGYLLRLPTSGPVPPIVTLMLTYRCNYNCIMCQKSSFDENEYHHPESMGLASVRQFIEDYGDRIAVLRLFGGEPLFHPDVLDVLDLVRKHRIAYTIGTNGSLLTPDVVDRITGNCAWISISLDSADDDNYAHIRKGGDLETIRVNLSHIRALKEQRGTRYPIVNASATVFTYNLYDLEDLIRFCKNEGIESLSLSSGRLYNTPHVTEEHLIQNDRDEARRVLDSAKALAERLDFNLRVRMRSLYLAPRTEEQKQRDEARRRPDLYFEMTVQPDFEAVTGFEGYRSMGKIAGGRLPQVWNAPDGAYASARSGANSVSAPIQKAS